MKRTAIDFAAAVLCVLASAALVAMLPEPQAQQQTVQVASDRPNA